MISFLSAVSAPAAHSHAFGETCTDCKGLGADGSWIFWAMIAALLFLIAFKFYLNRKRNR